MATYNSTVGDTALAYTDSHKAYVVKESVNIQTEATALATAGYFAAGDIIQVFDIPANTWVVAAGLIPTTAEGTTLTYDLGDGTTADGFVDGLDGNATTAAHAQIAEGYGAGTQLGKVYTSTDTLDLKLVTMGAQVSHAAVVTVWMVCFDLN
uniref:Putative structural protein n=1 Tax=viral metagenome TaxID=1070528 RepID=A0A6H1ZUQ8_9ZZZZ